MPCPSPRSVSLGCKDEDHKATTLIVQDFRRAMTWRITGAAPLTWKEDGDNTEWMSLSTLTLLRQVKDPDSLFYSKLLKVLQARKVNSVAWGRPVLAHEATITAAKAADVPQGRLQQWRVLP